MAELETQQETKPQHRETTQPDLLMAIPSPQGSDALQPVIAKVQAACGSFSTECRVMFALPAEESREVPVPLPNAGSDGPTLSVPFVNYALPAMVPGTIPGLPNIAVYGSIASLAGKLGVRACTILGTGLEFNRTSLTQEKLALLLDPALEGGFDLVMPLYTTQPFEHLVNKSILYPLTRALYGHRVQYPLGTEIQISAKLFPLLSSGATKHSTRMQGRLPWLATLAANRNLRICQVQLGSRRPTNADGIELSDALAQLAGPLFLDMEDSAAFWQHTRASHEVPTFGAIESPSEGAEQTVDVQHMLDAFRLGEQNLKEVWSLILPPVTLLELKKLSRLKPEQFHMEDALWAHIVYDFALAHRLRNIHRAHLFGALTPLYLGWVASYAVEINRIGIAAAQPKVEQLARAYESEKPYLLSRWRWPDRFHP